eukprot:s4985_g1.t1
MGSAADGEMPAETVVETPVAPVAATPVLTAAAPVLTAAAPVLTAAAPEASEVEKTEPSASRPETEKDAEGKHGADETPEEFDSEAVRAAKRARQEMIQAEVEEEGMSDHDITMKCLRLVQSSLEYTVRQAAALKAVQEQLGETASLAYHSESCQRYALAARTIGRDCKLSIPFRVLPALCARGNQRLCWSH